MADTQAPQLLSISVSTNDLDIDGGEKTLTVTAVFKDDQSGIFDGEYADGSGGSGPQIRFRSPSGQIVDGMFDILDPIAGNRLQGTFVAGIKLGSFAEDGEWKVEYLLLGDEARNSVSLYPESTPALDALTFEVHNTQSDATPPTLTAISVSDDVVDIDAGETTLTITARFSDAVSGIFDGMFADGSGGSAPQIRFVSSTGQIIDGLFDIENPTSGDRRNGTFKANVTFDQNAEAGDWRVEYLLLNDEAGNTVSLYPESTPLLDAIAFKVRNESGDSTAPTVEALNFGSPTLNSDGTISFVVEAHLRDDLSGLTDGLNANGIGVSPPQIRFVSASGQIADGMFDMSNPISGDALDGVFRAVVTLSGFAETGTWKIQYLYLDDEAGNNESYYAETTAIIPPDGIVLGTDLPDTVEGTDDPDAIYGFGGDDDLGGGSGGDTLNGGDGDDEVDGGAGDDEIVGGSGAGNDKYVGGAGFDTAVYKSAAKSIKVDLQKGKASGSEIGSDTLKQIEGVVAGRGSDTVKGGKGNNAIDGYLGKDKVTGGAGKDAFVFSTALGKKNVDTIKDFKPKDDIVHLDDGVFEGLSVGKLKASAFAVRKAKDTDDRIIYDDRKGTLFFDTNGNKKGGTAAFAKIGDDLDVTHKDFLVI